MGILEGYFDTCREALGSRDVSGEACHAIGGASFRFRCHGRRLSDELLIPLSHLPGGPAEAPLEVQLCESRSSGLARPPIPWARVDGPADRVERCAGEEVEAIVEGPADTLTLLRERERDAIYWVQELEALPVYERCAPLRPLLQWWLARRGLQLVHAAAVGTERGGVLLAGKGGSGKSTSALACLGSGLRYVADDYVAVDERSAYSVYNTAKLDARSVAMLPALRDAIENPDDLGREKGYAVLARHYPGQLIASFPIRAILVPRVTDGSGVRLTPLSRAQALAALAPSTLFQQRSTAPGAMVGMSGLVQRAPCYRIEVGSRLEEIPLRIQELLDALAAEPGDERRAGKGAGR